jgi:hypothetical protein
MNVLYLDYIENGDDMFNETLVSTYYTTLCHNKDHNINL